MTPRLLSTPPRVRCFLDVNVEEVEVFTLTIAPQTRSEALGTAFTWEMHGVRRDSRENRQEKSARGGVQRKKKYVTIGRCIS